MTKRRMSPLKISEGTRETHIAKQKEFLTPRQQKFCPDTTFNSVFLEQKLTLPKLKIHLKHRTNFESEKNAERSTRNFSVSNESKVNKKAVNEMFLKNLPARFKYIIPVGISHKHENVSSLIGSKVDVEIKQIPDSDEVRASVERTKTILNIEENFNKSKILKNVKESSWKWLTPMSTPPKTVRFREDN